MGIHCNFIPPFYKLYKDIITKTCVRENSKNDWLTFSYLNYSTIWLFCLGQKVSKLLIIELTEVRVCIMVITKVGYHTMKNIFRTIQLQKKLQVYSCFMTFVMLFISIHNINDHSDYRINWLSQLLFLGLYFNSEKIFKDGSWLRLFIIFFLCDYLMSYLSLFSFCFIQISLLNAVTLALLSMSLFTLLTFYSGWMAKNKMV